MRRRHSGWLNGLAVMAGALACWSVCWAEADPMALYRHIATLSANGMREGIVDASLHTFRESKPWVHRAMLEEQTIANCTGFMCTLFGCTDGAECTNYKECTDGSYCTMDNCTRSECTYEEVCTSGDQCTGNGQHHCTEGKSCTGGGVDSYCTKGADCTGGRSCTHDKACTSSPGCTAGLHCTEGQNCTYGDACTESAGCTGGYDPGTGMGCTTSQRCTNGQRCTEGHNCTLQACSVRGQCTMGPSCSKGHNCTVAVNCSARSVSGCSVGSGSANCWKPVLLKDGGVQLLSLAAVGTLVLTILASGRYGDAND
ncbi:hypothetical protein HRbin15_02200 [bacterium HR15]|nr:hypothetical protein HRbin15_02200 [bacterium HR15]